MVGITVSLCIVHEWIHLKSKFFPQSEIWTNYIYLSKKIYIVLQPCCCIVKMLIKRVVFFFIIRIFSATIQNYIAIGYSSNITFKDEIKQRPHYLFC